MRRKMNENRVCLINMFVTATIGFGIFSLIYSQEEPIKLLVLLLLYPVSFYITKLFIKTGVKNPFIGFFQGGIFSVIGAAIVLGLTSTFGKFRFFDPGGADGFMAIIWFFTAVIAFIVGGIAGAIISAMAKRS